MLGTLWKSPAVAGPAALVERNLVIYRHTWYLLLAEIFEPVLYLLSMGVGIGALVGHVPGLGDPSVGYVDFVAPGLLATAAMNGAMNETTFNIYGKLKMLHTYDSILATPLRIRDVALGEVAWALLRGTAVTVVFGAAVAAFGLVHSLWALLILPGALLIAFAFAAAGLAVVTYIRSWQDFQLVQLVMLPMFLFATTFYPLGVYARPVQIAVECLPLYQSIELIREPSLGVVDAGVGWAAGYLLLFGCASMALALRRLERTLVP
ncbi:ABC transporter permease [Streptomyces cocklensis]|jgi:lipooligosaccharide transport system permease protein|uniref:Transport permease protein n=1 Tax=Actinacidiphila cocklensis TaxID=887465 RepID=A0A9W4DPC5_9ACTN|nr:ABC transporter permease [Actinacidiphila cocklensis]MDD1057537.1 ABC transporter permease [Actinacidiphila cocklensis]CAG6393838.1 Transport permease protein [Actinacidiphila cocklensis]